MDKFFHILCTDSTRVIYEGRFQCPTRASALNILRDKIGKQNLCGLTYTVTEIPIEIIREVVDAILNDKKIPEGDIVKFDTEHKIATAKGFGMIYNNKRNPKAPKNVNGITRRLGDL